jgi:putative transposase
MERSDIACHKQPEGQRLDYVPVAEASENVRIKRLLDEIYLRATCLGSRRLVAVLERDHGLHVNRKRL